MTVIQKTIRVPESHRIILDIPAGNAADIVVSIAVPARESRAKTLLSLAGALADSKTFAGDSVKLVRGIRDEW